MERRDSPEDIAEIVVPLRTIPPRAQRASGIPKVTCELSERNPQHKELSDKREDCTPKWSAASGGIPKVTRELSEWRNLQHEVMEKR